jgi:hypothetical protein
VPLLLAIALFYGRAYLPVPDSISHGQLIRPARPIELFRASTEHGDEMTKDYFEHYWSLVLVSNGGCNLECEAALFKMRQARFLTGKDIQRVQMIVLARQQTQVSPHLREVLRRFPKVELVFERALKFEDSNSAPPLQLNSGEVYIVDPLGNVMMHYPADSTTKGMLKDLKKLLRISKVG